MIDWYCPTYHCRMTERSCLLRKKYAQDKRHPGVNSYRNAGCATCTKGEQIEVKTKTCKKCGVVLPMDYFPTNSECKDGHEGTCKECKKKRVHDSAAKIAPGSEKKCKACGVVKPIDTCHDAAVQQVVTVDFRDYPDIFNEITIAAKDEVRTVGCQIIWLLKSFGR